MGITFYCGGCGKRLSAPDGTAGKYAKCPGCWTRVLIPADADVPMAAAQRGGEVFEAQPAAEGTAPTEPLTWEQEVGASGKDGLLKALRIASFVGLGALVATGVTMAMGGIVEAVKDRNWRPLLAQAPESLVFFVLAGLLGYLGSRGGIKRLEHLAGEVRDVFAPRCLAVLALLAALAMLWTGIEMAVYDNSYALSAACVGLCAGLVITALLWFRPTLVGTAVVDDSDERRRPLLNVVLSIVELCAKVTLAGSVALFAVGGVFAFMGLVACKMAVWVGGVPYQWSGQESALRAILVMLAAAPFLAYVFMLLSYAFTQWVRLLIATEDNTRRSAQG